MVRRGLRFESGRGLCKSAACRRFSFRLDLHDRQRAVAMEPFVEPSGGKTRTTGLSPLVSRSAVYGPGGGGKQKLDA